MTYLVISHSVFALQLLRLVGLRSISELLEPCLLLLLNPCIKAFLKGGTLTQFSC